MFKTSVVVMLVVPGPPLLLVAVMLVRVESFRPLSNDKVVPHVDLAVSFVPAVVNFPTIDSLLDCEHTQ